MDPPLTAGLAIPHEGYDERWAECGIVVSQRHDFIEELRAEV